jgi:hypothetical protein
MTTKLHASTNDHSLSIRVSISPTRSIYKQIIRCQHGSPGMSLRDIHRAYQPSHVRR